MSSWYGQALAVFIGSGLGGTARFGIARLTVAVMPTTGDAMWPKLAGTWLVNVIGSMALTWLLARHDPAAGLSPPVQLALTTGVMGGFTTYSTFNAELLSLWHQGRGREALLYGGVTLATCALCGWFGWTLGSR